MNQLRVRYIVVIITVLIIGLLSRYFSFVPLWVGDFFYAVLVFFMLRFLMPLRTLKLAVILSLMFCYLIELSQLYQAAWINDTRKTIFGRLVLGQGFLWSDIIAYSAGIAFAALVDHSLNKTLNKKAGR